MNDGHILVTIIAAFVVAQTLAVGVFMYLRSVADLKMVEAMAAAKKSESGGA